MLKRNLCEATFEWGLACEGPLLIADGRYDQKEVMRPYENNRDEKKKRGGWYPDKFFINQASSEVMISNVRNAGAKPPVYEWGFYVPGTSIRGPFRSQAERIIRSLLPESAPPDITACDPFEAEDRKTRSCSQRLEEESGNRTLYSAACPACRLFGCAGLASRIQFTDAAVEGSFRSVYRDMIGIDRFTGGVYQGGEGGGGANMRFHALEKTEFTTRITVRNFELWHLGLMAYVFRDFEQARVPIGFGKTKGFGQVRGEVKKIVLTYPKHVSKAVAHLGSLMDTETERVKYDVTECKTPAFDRFETTDDDLSFYRHHEVKDIPGFWKIVAPAFNDHIARLEGRLRQEEGA